MVSPCSVFLCRIFSSFVNLSGVPSSLLPITLVRTHSLVGVPPEIETVVTVWKEVGRSECRVSYACYTVFVLSSGLIMDLDSGHV